MSSRRRIENFPDWAESQFATLCDEAGVTRNKSSQDRSGWDYIVEFERSRLVGIPHDKQPGSVSARVQVKSSTTVKKSTTVKLTNALRFCRNPEPCFVVLFTDRGKSGTRKIYAREFDETLISAALKRAREADRDGVEKLHLINIPISFDGDCEHTDDLIDWMRCVCDVDPAIYAKNKSDLNETVGYNATRVVGTFRLPTTEIQSLIDHTVGMPGSFSLDQIEMRDQRFEIPAREPFLSGKPDKVEMRVHPKKAQLIFRSDDGKSAHFAGEFRGFNLPGLDDASFRATFKSPHVQAELRGRKLHISYEFKASERLPLTAIRNELTFRMIRREPMTVELSVEGSAGPISLPIEMTSPDAGLEWEDWFNEVTAELSKVARPADKPRLSLDDLGLSAGTVSLFAAATADRNLLSEVVLEDVPSGQLNPTCLAYYAYLHLGDSTFSLIASRPLLDQSCIGQDLKLNFGHPIVHERSARRGDVDRHLPRLKRRFTEISKRLGPGTVMIEHGDFMQIADRTGPFEISM